MANWNDQVRHARSQIWAACLQARARGLLLPAGNVNDQPLRHVVDEVPGVAQFDQLPAEGVAEARLLVDPEIVLLAKAECLAADLLQHRDQPPGRDVRPTRAALRIRRALLCQFLRQRLRKLVDLFGGDRTKYSHGSRGIMGCRGAGGQ